MSADTLGYDPERWTMANRDVETYDRSRLVLNPGRTRRHRERIVLSFCAEGWLNNDGFAAENNCRSIFDDKTPGFRERYHAFHADRHVTWRVQEYRSRSCYSSYYCDAHFPDEYREMIFWPRPKPPDHLFEFVPGQA